MRVNPYLLFNGDCEAAFKFYAQTLGGRIEAMIPYEGTPAAAQMPPDGGKKILHAHIIIDGQSLMGGDAPPGYYSKPQGFSVSINLKEPAEADRIFRTLAENGKVKMPIQETFWAARFAMLVDRFGIPWIVNCEKLGEKAA